MKNHIPYQRVEFLLSKDKAYINTNISGNDDNLEINIDFLYTTYYNYYGICGNFLSNDHNATQIMLSQKDARALTTLNTKSAGGGTGFPLKNNERTKVIFNSKYIIANGVYVERTNQTKGENNNNHILLFTTTTSAMQNLGLRIYSFSISTKGKKLIDFIPVRVNNVGYMYDKVSGKLFGNVGTGEFILGPDL